MSLFHADKRRFRRISQIKHKIFRQSYLRNLLLSAKICGNLSDTKLHFFFVEKQKKPIFGLSFHSHSIFMTSEEYRNMLKEQYKKDLRERKQFVEKVQELKKQEPLLKAIEGLKVEDDSDDWIEKLNQQTAFMDAKTELAADSIVQHQQQVEHTHSEAELQKIAAQQLLLEMKRQMGLLPAEEAEPVAEVPKTEEIVAEKEADRPLFGDF